MSASACFIVLAVAAAVTFFVTTLWIHQQGAHNKTGLGLLAGTRPPSLAIWFDPQVRSMLTVLPPSSVL